MAKYIGGDTAELEYDFYTKTAGSTVDCPMKIYKGEVDPSALPAPTDVLWQEITSQSILDKLKAQNEIVTSNLATDKSTIMWGDKTLTKTATIKVTDDFASKVSGSIVENPNIAKNGGNTTILLAPSDALFLEFVGGYDNIKTLNGTSTSSSKTTNGQMAQQLFSFDLISIFERKFGTIPKETVAEKVAWLKNNLGRLDFKWYGYGSCPSGNKAYVSVWNGSWVNNAGNNTNNTPTLLQSGVNGGSSPLTNMTDGFMHFLAYTDASNGVTASTIYTDYVSIELTLKAPESLITATNTLSDIVTDFTGKVSGSVAENANIAKHNYGGIQTSLLNPSSFTNEYSTVSYNKFNTLNAISDGSTVTVNGAIPQMLFSFNIISAVEKQLGQPIPAVDKVQWCKDNVDSIKYDWTGYGNNPSGNKAYIDVFNPQSSVWIYKNANLQDLTGYNNTANSPSLISLTAKESNTYVKISNSIDSNGMFNMIAYTSASDGVTASTIYTDYVKLTIKLKYVPTYDFYTDSNTRRDAGLTDVVLVKRSIGDMASDFTGKVVGSIVENANISKIAYNSSGNTNTSLLNPSSFTVEASADTYSRINTLNSVVPTVMENRNNYIPQHLFSFNLIEIAQRQLGTSIPGADTASKVQWLKDNLSSVIADWHGFGSCPTGNKAMFTVWADTDWSTSVRQTHTSSNVTKLTVSLWSPYTRIQSDGFIHYLAYTDASNGTIASVISTDYIKLTLAFKTDTVGYEYFTNNSSEISVTTNNKASAFLIELDLTSIATSLYGGSNASLKSALKSIEADVWAMGSGASVNQLGHSTTSRLWFDYSGGTTGTAGWGSLSGVNITKTTSYVTPYNLLLNDGNVPKVPTNSNKIYIIVYSNYKSDGTIPSEVNLDYVNIKVKLARTPDVITPIPITLGDTWSVLLKGFSPSWSSSRSIRKIFALVKDTNYLVFQYLNTNGNLQIVGANNNVTFLNYSSIPELNTKFKAVNYLFSIDNINKTINVFVLLNNGTVLKYTINASDILKTKDLDLYILSSNGIQQADAFLDNLYFFNNNTFNDEEAEVLLRGRNTIIGKENDAHLNELASIYKSPTIATGTILPNNRYIVTGQAKLYCNNVLIRTVQDAEFTTSKYENKIELVGTAEVRRLD